jgi:general secretion pathway protein K
MDNRRGSILIIILWSLFFLSALALAISAYIRPRLDLGGRLLRKTRAHYSAASGVKRAMLEIEKDGTELYDCMSDTWGDVSEGSIGGSTFSVELVDEERKININKAPYDVLKDFFEIVGETSSQDAEDLADSLIDWRDEDDDARDNGAEDGYYSMRRPGYDCKNADFELPEELLAVKGMTRELFGKVKDRITVYGEGGVNINTTDGLVLRSLGMSEELAAKVIDFRDKGGNIFEDAGKIASALNESEDLSLSSGEASEITKIFARGFFAVRSANFTGYSVGRIENRADSAKIAFVYDRDEKTIKYWRE